MLCRLPCFFSVRSISFTKYERALAAFYAEVDPDFIRNIAAARQVLQEEKNLAEIVQLVGKDSLGEDQKVSLEVSRLLREDYLQQNGFSVYDYTWSDTHRRNTHRKRLSRRCVCVCESRF